MPFVKKHTVRIAQPRSKKTRLVVGLSSVLGALCALAMANVQCTTLESGRKSLAILPESQMHALGHQAFLEMAKTEKETTNAALKETIGGIAQRVTQASGAAFKWEFRVFESEQINAFCLPGGKIGIYTGILPIAQSNAGLAAVIGHEIAHATLKHGNERMSQGLLLQLGLQASDLALSDSKLRTPILAALGLGAQVGAVLPFVRFQESEADRIGLKYMVAAGFDGQEAAALWGRMAAHKKKVGASSPPNWLSTHPNNSTRQEDLRVAAAKLQRPDQITVPTKKIW